jgi:glycosyltransferase involved in cell wall biosynthesis
VTPPSRLSVVLPNYNHAHFLRESLDALTGQTRPADQIVIVDDASTDDSTSIIEEFRAAHPSITVIENDVNQGVN